VSGRIGPLLTEHADAEGLRRLVQHLPGVLLVYRAVAGRRGRFEFVSPRAREVLGVEPEPLMNDALLVLGRIDQADLARLQARAARCSVLGQPVHMRLHLAGRDPCWVEVNASGQPQGGDVVWYTHVRRVAGAGGGHEGDEGLGAAA
jgi:PAS domain-containing protein